MVVNKMISEIVLIQPLSALSRISRNYLSCNILVVCVEKLK